MRPAMFLAFACLPILCAAGSVANGPKPIDVWPGGGVFAQVVDSAEWKTTFYITNMDSTVANVILLLSDDRGDPLPFPIGGARMNFVTFTLKPDETRFLETDGVGSLKQGMAMIFTCDRDCSDPASQAVRGKVGASAVIRQHIDGRTDSESVVPLEQPESHVHVVFDGRAGFVTGIAILNVFADSVAVTIRDQDGIVLVTDTLALAKMEKKVFVLEQRYPKAVGKYGIVEFRGDGIIAMGLRFNPQGAFTSSHAMSVH